jgi:fructokinase
VKDGLRLGVETGGTKILARIVGPDGRVVADGRWPTSTPQAALEVISGFVETSCGMEGLESAGIAAFGPLMLHPAADAGRMLSTPKPGWAGSNLRRMLEDRLHIPIAIDTDVNAAARAEHAIGAGRGLDSLAYVTVGTGIGGGLSMACGTLKGALHPEIGHIRLHRAAGDMAPSQCRFHGDCAEGLAAGPAVGGRLAGDLLCARDDVRDLVADYLAQLVAALVLSWSPHRVAFGGGVAGAPGMIDAIRKAFPDKLADYGVGEAAVADDFIVPAQLCDAGLEGALLLAADAADG